MVWIIISLVIIVPVLAIVLIAWSISAPKYKGPVTDHFDGKKFINPGNVKPKGFGDVLKWMTNRKQGEWTKISSLPGEPPPPDRAKDGELLITFINHCTFLIQVDGVNILTDPIWSERASPFTWVGPKRMRPPGLKLEDLPSIDVLLISHNHYDHLDIETVKSIYRKHKPKVITSLGVGSYLKKHGVSDVTELDWKQEFILNERTSFVSVPAQHFSGRGMFDRDATLWCGFVIRSKHGNIYFAADTGYNETVNAEVKKSTPLRAALLPIGAYRPEWFMSVVHASPHESVKMHVHLDPVISIGNHFGTFPLADEGMHDPAKDLASALAQHNVPQEKFIVPKEGKTISVKPLA